MYNANYWNNQTTGYTQTQYYTYPTDFLPYITLSNDPMDKTQKSVKIINYLIEQKLLSPDITITNALALIEKISELL